MLSPAHSPSLPPSPHVPLGAPLSVFAIINDLESCVVVSWLHCLHHRAPQYLLGGSTPKPSSFHLVHAEAAFSG